MGCNVYRLKCTNDQCNSGSCVVGSSTCTLSTWECVQTRSARCMSMSYCHSHSGWSVTGDSMRPLGALKHFSPSRLSAVVARRVHAHVATPTSPAAMQDLSYDAADTKVDRSLSLDASADQPSGAASFRHLPLNYVPETRFSVDSVAAADATNFRLHPSVEFWANYNTRFNSRSLSQVPEDTNAGRNDQLSKLVSTLRELVSTSALADAESAAYWAYHTGRTGFFLGVSASGAIAHYLAEQAKALSTNSTPQRTPLENLSANVSNELSNRLLEAVAVYKQDLEYIKDGQYKLPWDMTTLSHRQYNPLFVLGKSAEFVSEAIATLNRRVAQASADNWFSSNMYPKYYADNTYHYQSDGWFSDRSASVYEFSTEALFFGRQDAMQRTSLLPLAQHIRDRGLDPSQMKVLEACCGTGRFHTFLKDNYPTMDTICADLSPFYLARARSNVRYWKSQKAPSLELGGADGAGTEFMQCAVESMPLADNSLDAVMCMYAFHEMPEDARAAAAAEMFRVLKPGGLAVLTDSVQLGDRPQWDSTLGAFGNFNEPHYRNYIACDFGALFRAAGFECGTKYVVSATKTLSFVKPEGHSGSQNDAFTVPSAAAVDGSYTAMGTPELN